MWNINTSLVHPERNRAVIQVLQVLQVLRRYRDAHQAVPLAVPVPAPPEPPAPPRRRRWAITYIGMPQQGPTENQLVDEAIVAAARAGMGYHVGDVPPASPWPDGQVIGTARHPHW
jgi:hypothetical protein